MPPHVLFQSFMPYAWILLFFLRTFVLFGTKSFQSKTSMEILRFLDIKLSTFFPEPTSPLQLWFHLMCP